MIIDLNGDDDDNVNTVDQEGLSLSIIFLCLYRGNRIEAKMGMERNRTKRSR